MRNARAPIINKTSNNSKRAYNTTMSMGRHRDFYVTARKPQRLELCQKDTSAILARRMPTAASLLFQLPSHAQYFLLFGLYNDDFADDK